MNGNGNEALGCSGLSVRFGELWANREVSLSVPRREIHAVVGENGAGKSTLMRALYGLQPFDTGEVRLFGERVVRPSVAESIRRKVGMVHQHFMLVPTLTVVENAVLGREPRRGPFLDLAAPTRQLLALSEEHGLTVEPARRAGELSVGEAQRVEILKVLWRGAEALILDEPTAVLSPPEVDRLLAVLRRLRDGGHTVVLVTHKLDEVLQVADRVTILRRGEVVETVAVADTHAAALTRAIVGHDVAPSAYARASPPGAPQLTVVDLEVLRDDGSPAVAGVSFEVRGGEILGIAGVEGNGQRELQLALAGVELPRAGTIRLGGAEVTLASVRRRRALGLRHIPEDRLGRGLLVEGSIADNLYLGREPGYGGLFTRPRRRLERDARMVIDRFDVRPPEPTARAGGLSGGNQQKVVVGRELLDHPQVLICAQPTRGVDVGAIEKIHSHLLALRASGAAILLFSAELDELLQLADRLAVMSRGRFVGVVDNDPARGPALREELGRMMVGA
jgi:simple sugar transport system ATP-binding protein